MTLVDDPGVTEWPLRRFTLVHTGARPMTMNAARSMREHAWANHTRTIRRVWWALALEAKLPRLQQARITATPLHSSGRSWQDAAACAPEVKAAVDGLVDAHVLPDDDARHLVEIRFLGPRLTNADGLELVIEEVRAA